MLLVWTPTSKSSKDTLVRILYTGACPQTLVFEALGRVRHLEFLHESPQQQNQASRASTVRTTSSVNSSTSMKNPSAKPKPTFSASSGETVKVISRTVTPKPKTSSNTALKSDKSRSSQSVTKADKKVMLEYLYFILITIVFV